MWSEIRLVQELDKITFDLFLNVCECQTQNQFKGFPVKLLKDNLLQLWVLKSFHIYFQPCLTNIA